MHVPPGRSADVWTQAWQPKVRLSLVLNAGGSPAAIVSTRFSDEVIRQEVHECATAFEVRPVACPGTGLVLT